ncbi:MAG: hypothetical protein IPI00_07405 [Flavobacteriales bacterium]|nr:hypothetical protein [Flavobacteriales bacterium]MBK6943781.1 hypothetical protein [Flavobacteriales bacterium]MBK7239992.1 hypothetical protein [Flavobacteriales bacterium]MBK7297035.1 hypothetical protein [Flavobacteriales bacterium]MBK9535687.1 hypothetical protein [Flavobacteriales bacterium]
MNPLNYLAAAALSLAVIVPSQLHAQSFEEGSKAINLGVGIGGYSRYAVGYNRVGVSPTFLAAMDIGFKKAGPGIIGIGGVVGLKASRSSSIYGDYHSTHLVVGVRGTYHWNEWHGREDLDIYGGVMFGMNIRLSERYEYGNSTTNTLVNNYPIYDVFVGARYMFANILGVYAEVGPGVTLVNGGLTLMF